MAKLVYGRTKQLTFQSQQDLYISIGFLSKAKIRLYIEDNNINLSGGEEAWAEEWRMSFSEISDNIPQSIKNSIKPNRDGSNPRLNNKEFINELLKKEHRFQLGNIQNVQLIRNTIPNTFLDDFEYGLSL